MQLNICNKPPSYCTKWQQREASQKDYTILQQISVWILRSKQSMDCNFIYNETDIF